MNLNDYNVSILPIVQKRVLCTGGLSLTLERPVVARKKILKSLKTEFLQNQSSEVQKSKLATCCHAGYRNRASLSSVPLAGRQMLTPAGALRSGYGGSFEIQQT